LNYAPSSKRPVPDEFLVARADKQLSGPAHDAARSDPVTRMTTFLPSAVNGDRPLLGRRAVRGFIGFLFVAACVGFAATAWQSFYAHKAEQPQLVLTASLEKRSELPAQPNPSTVQTDVAKATPPQPAPPQPTLLAQTAPKDVAPTTGALPPDLAQLLKRKDEAKEAPIQPGPPARPVPEGVAPSTALPPELAQVLQTMSRDLATVGQGIEQLKANQAQLARDNAKLAEELKANQEQMARVIAKASEQNLRPKTSAPRPPAPVR
jgi:hypothetical protein